MLAQILQLHSEPALPKVSKGQACRVHQEFQSTALPLCLHRLTGLYHGPSYWDHGGRFYNE